MSRTTRFSLSVGGPIAADAVEDGMRAERLGFDFVWAADHISDIPPISAVFDAWTLLAYIGAKTKNVKLASGVTDIQRMHPAKMASVMTTLDNLTRGRAVLGIGAGEVMNVRPYGMAWESADVRILRFREYLKVIRLLWSSSYDRRVGFRGDFYSLDDAHLGLPPFKPNPPIYVGAFASKSMLQIAGELADGWFPGIFYTATAFREKVDIIDEAARKAGRASEDIDLIANVPVVLQPDAATLRVIKKKLRWSLFTSREMLRMLGARAIADQLPKDFEYQLITPTKGSDKILIKTMKELTIPNDIIERGLRELMAVGNLDTCLESIRRYIKAGATHIHVQTYVGSGQNLELVAKKILPHFRE